MDYPYHSMPCHDDFPNISQQKLISADNPDTLIAVPLGFTLPFYGRFYDTVYTAGNGYLQLTKDKLPIPYHYYFDNPLLLRIYPLIAPFLHHDLIFLGQDDGVWMEREDGTVTFRWRKHLDTRQRSILYDFAVKLSSDGAIRFFYNTLDLVQDVQYTAGISNGNDRNYHFLDPPAIAPFTAIRIIPGTRHAALPSPRKALSPVTSLIPPA
jgi:hypothetical protein